MGPIKTASLSRDLFDAALGYLVPWYVMALELQDVAELVYSSLAASDIKPPSFTDGPGWPQTDDWIQVSPVISRKNIYVFLAGLALENLLKAEIIRRDPKLVTGGQLPKKLLIHDLGTLAQAAQFDAQMSKGEKATLRVATEACGSWGRYPGGIAYDRGQIAPPDDLDLEHFKSTFDALFRRLAECVTQGLRDP